MSETDDLRREIEALRARSAALNAAILRVNASLDLRTVLSETLESARALTGARWGALASVDEAGAPQDFLTSGFTPEEDEALLAWPHSQSLFEHFRGLPGPVRVDDLATLVRALGIEPVPMFSRSFQGTPMRHRGADVGNFFLADKAEGEAFTDADEEVLTLFAAQAASAIANARVHRDERRAKADLEALVETSPVGVLVLDAATGRAVSFNREARRIAESLRQPGHPPEQVLEVLSLRRADGTEATLDEFPVAELAKDGETMRAEEVTLSVPDGRSVRTLVNASPVRAEDGAIRSVIVTVQDLAPLEEVERLRTEFLGLVGHELREPLAAIKGSTATLMEDAALDPAEIREFHRIIAGQADHMRSLIGDLLDAGRIDAGALSVAPEPSELADLVEQARDTFAGGGGRHGIVVDLPVDLPRAMADRRRVVQVLNNLLANAARHAPEPSPIRVSAAREGAHVAVSVSDEGRGIAPEMLARLFDKHVSGSPMAGHGLGLAICKGLVEAHGGRIRAESPGPGLGSVVTFTLPVAGGPGAGEAAKPAPDGRPGGRARILVVDDDPRTLRFVRDALSAAGYDPLMTGDPSEIALIVRRERPLLVLLDLVLPGQDGIALMQEVPELSDLPVIFISGYGRDETVVAALDAGAADYVVKPFSAAELVARVRAALRRHESPEPFVLGDLSVDFDRRRVSVGGEPVALTPTEYELLRVLALDAGRVVSHETLLRRIWSGRNGAGPNVVRVAVGTLRRKLGDDAESPSWIFSERGVGYRMPAPGEE